MEVLFRVRTLISLLVELIFFFTSFNGSWGLRDVKLIVVPAAVQRGGSAILHCQYDLEGAPLYSVSWYRGTHEFYRHSPSEIPANKYFKFGGIYVDETLSNSTQVVLRDVSFSLSGNFSCEVTTDAPSFSTLIVSSQMTVVELPETPPVIYVERDRYTLGETLRANCTSPPSRPPAELTFQINNIPVTASAIERHSAETILLSNSKIGHRWSPSSDSVGIAPNRTENVLYTTNNNNLQWSTATLNIQLMSLHFGGQTAAITNSIGQTQSAVNTLKVTCTASVPPSDYKRTVTVQLTARLGEPIHERVMSPSSSTTAWPKQQTITLLILALIINHRILLSPQIWRQS